MGGAAHIIVLEDQPQGVIAALDPRTRLLSALAFVIGLIALNAIVPLVLALAVSLVLVRLAALPFEAMRHRLMHLEGFMIVLLAMLPFTIPGHPLLTLGPFVATDEGLLRAVTLAIRVNAAVLAVFALLGSIEPVRLGQALARLRVPLALVHLFLFAVRYLGVFRAETTRLIESMRARAFVARSNRHTWRTFGNLAGMMLVRSVERAERVSEAMRCRAFSGRFPLACADRFGRADAAFAAAIVLVVVGLLAADHLT